MRTFEARIKETCLRCFRADPTLIGLYSTEDDKKLEMLALERIVLIMERKPCFPRTRLISCKIVGFETSLMTLTSGLTPSDDSLEEVTRLGLLHV